MLRGAIDRETIIQQSRALVAASAKLPPEEQEHNGAVWRASRNYLVEDDQELFRELPEEELEEGEAEALLQAEAFNPLIAAVTAAAQCRCGRLKLDGAFSTLYSGETKGMTDHIDYRSNGEVVPVSAILQCHTDAGFEGGGLWMRPNERSPDSQQGDGPPPLQDAAGRVLLELAAGDLLLLEGAWHQPREIIGSASERLVLVCFFALDPEQQPEPEPEPHSAD